MAVFIALALLNVWASWRIVADHLSSWQQRCAQLAFVWLVPVIGALVTLYLKREPERGSGTYREVPDAGDDLGYTAQARREERAHRGNTAEHSEPQAPDQ